MNWERIVFGAMIEECKTDMDLETDKNVAYWKVKIARELRKSTTSSNIWTSQRLKMGHPNYPSNIVNEYKS